MPDTLDPRFAPPLADVMDVVDVAPGQLVLAGRGARLMSFFVDMVVGFAVAMVVAKIPFMQAMVKAQSPTDPTDLWNLTPLAVIVGIPMFLLVQGWPLVTRGQTIGKFVLKLRIVRPDGSRASAWRLLGLRYGIGLALRLCMGVSMIYAAVDTLLIFRGSRKCLHDTIADTLVVKLTKQP